MDLMPQEQYSVAVLTASVAEEVGSRPEIANALALGVARADKSVLELLSRPFKEAGSDALGQQAVASQLTSYAEGQLAPQQTTRAQDEIFQNVLSNPAMAMRLLSSQQGAWQIALSFAPAGAPQVRQALAQLERGPKIPRFWCGPCGFWNPFTNDCNFLPRCNGQIAPPYCQTGSTTYACNGPMGKYANFCIGNDLWSYDGATFTVTTWWNPATLKCEFTSTGCAGHLVPNGCSQATPTPSITIRPYPGINGNIRPAVP